jgi:hypothetical protein
VVELDIDRLARHLADSLLLPGPEPCLGPCGQIAQPCKQSPGLAKVLTDHSWAGAVERALCPIGLEERIGVKL